MERRIGEAELSSDLERLDFADALVAADRALASGIASRSRWEDAVVYLYGTEANRLAKAGELLAAAAAAEAGAAKAPGKSATLSRYATELKRAFVATAHNEFAALYNAGDYQASLAALDRALALLPKDATLAAPLATDRKAALEAILAATGR